MDGRMVRLELKHGFKALNGVLELLEFFVREAELEIEGSDSGIDFLRLLKRLGGLFGLIQVKMRKTHQVKGSPVIVVELEGFLGFGYYFLIFVGEQIGVGEIQAGIDAFGRELDGV